MQHRQEITVNHGRGLHARVAAMVCHKAVELIESHGVVEIELGTADGRRVPATSVLAVLSLNVRRGDRVVIVARGGKAKKAAGEMAAFLSDDLGEGGSLSPAAWTTFWRRPPSPPARSVRGNPATRWGGS